LLWACLAVSTPSPYFLCKVFSEETLALDFGDAWVWLKVRSPALAGLSLPSLIVYGVSSVSRCGGARAIGANPANCFARGWMGQPAGLVPLWGENSLDGAEKCNSVASSSGLRDSLRQSGRRWRAGPLPRAAQPQRASSPGTPIRPRLVWCGPSALWVGVCSPKVVSQK
jgi:hypothetical protein